MSRALPHSPTLCLLRLSALGDATHVVPLVRTLQRGLPGLRLRWVIGRGEHRLLEGLPGVDFIEYDKRSGLAGLRALRAGFAAPVDALLQLQLSLRANLVSLAIPARRRIGYDRARSKELHGLVVGERIPHAPGGHVLDAIGRFAEPLGLRQDRVEWDLPVPQDARLWAQAQWPADGRPVLLVSPCSSFQARNWRPERYAAVADHAALAHGFRVVLVGGRSALERETADAILAAMKAPALDLVGRDTLKQLLAMLERADLVMSPDSGPMHMANAMGTKVLGLHAATDPARSGPYSDRRYTVDRFDAAARAFLGKPADALPWATKIHEPGVMDLIEVGDAIEALERFVADRAAGRLQAPAG